MKRPLKVGDKITVISISSMMATTITTRWTVSKETPSVIGPGTRPTLRLGVGKLQFKRKEYIISIEEHSSLVFEGWEIPFCSDMDARRPGGNSFCGNACINLCGDPEVIRDWITNRNLNDHFCSHANVIVLPPSGEPLMDNSGKLLYPDADSAGHAIVDRMKTEQ